MQATKQQQIMGYFIEEAKEHLDTIEQGLLNLKATMADNERLNELFRAAHSVKGGAAMLGLNSIQKVGHHLEDCFKLLTEHPVEIDRPLEDLFLQGFDVLKELVEELQSPYGLREEDAAQTVKATEPVFAELQRYLNQRLQVKATPVSPAVAPALSGKSLADLAALLNAVLKKMLELFKQGDSPTGRQQLVVFCGRAAQIHGSPEWENLLQTAQAAIGNTQNSYQAIAPLIIKELKQAGDLLVANRGSEITPSSQLLQRAGKAAIVPAPMPAGTQPQPQPRESSAPPARLPQITIPAEPRAAAKALLNAFNKEQLIELAEFLMKAIQ